MTNEEAGTILVFEKQVRGIQKILFYSLRRRMRGIK
jgi:hypothetical protein